MSKALAVLITILSLMHLSPTEDVDIVASTEREVYYFGETVFIRIVMDNRSDRVATVKTGSRVYGLLGQIVIRDSAGQVVPPYLIVDANGYVTLNKKQREEMLVPLDVYWKRHPCSVGGVFDVGKYSWELQLPIDYDSGEASELRSITGSFEVVHWPRSLQIVFDAFKDVVVGEQGKATQGAHTALQEILTGVEEPRMKVLLLNKLVYYAKSLDMVSDYHQHIDALKQLSKDSAAARRALMDERKVTKNSKFQFE